MTCKNLQVRERLPEVPPGSVYPTVSGKDYFCQIPGRQPKIIGWASRCEKVSEEGPCWWWRENYGDESDPDFQ